ncbi:MAG: hypothetical protein COB17_03620 [Sulfurimonas sp.]|nr:MAG: hypothetical protein COB17_03620 [Sulfurimonas sp.]
MKSIALEWKSIKDSRVKGIYIYRLALDIDDASSNEYYDTVSNRYATHYLDTDIKPDSRYSYYFKTYSLNAQSLASKTTTISSLPIMQSVSWIHSVADMPRSAKIIWRPHSNQKVKAYLIQRRTLKADVWDDIAIVDGRLNVEFIDKKLKDKFTYKYRIKALTYDDITSKPSSEVTVVTKALPLEVRTITATTNLAKKIEIKWSKFKGNDFSYYNLYKSKNVDTGYKLLKKINNNFYVDLIENDASRFFYRVSIVDKDGLESKYKKISVMGTTLNKPLSPALVEAKLINGEVHIRWSKADPRAVTYTVSKRYNKSLFNESKEDFEGIKGSEFIDKEIFTDSEYYYMVYSVDKNYIKSEPSIEIVIKTNKNDTTLRQDNIEKTTETEITPVKDVNKDVIIINNDFN